MTQPIHIIDPFFAVEKPVKAKYWRIDGVPNGAFYELIFYKDSECIDCPEEIEEVKIIDLPDGTWEIICTSKELESKRSKDDSFIILQALLSSKNCDPNKNYIILKKVS